MQFPHGTEGTVIDVAILIKNMEMPKTCSDCPIDYDFVCCQFFDKSWVAMGFDNTEGRHLDCPLVELTKPHGRLIDADELKNKYSGWYNMIDGKSIRAVQAKEIDWMPTVIEAE